jgi:hypothetical protein
LGVIARQDTGEVEGCVATRPTALLPRGTRGGEIASTALWPSTDAAAATAGAALALAAATATAAVAVAAADDRPITRVAAGTAGGSTGGACMPEAGASDRGTNTCERHATPPPHPPHTH